MKKIFLAAILVSAMFVGACTTKTRITDYTIVSTRNINFPASAKELGEGVGDSCWKMYVWFIPSGEANLRNAIDAAIESKGGDILANAVVYQTFKAALGGIFSKYCYEVRGTVYKTPTN